MLLYAGLQNTKLFADALRYLFGLMAPFVIGGCIAFVLNVPMRFFETKLFSRLKPAKGKRAGKAKRIFSLILTLVVVGGVIAIMLFLIVPELYQSFSAIGREMSYARVRIPQLLDEATALLPMFESEIASIKDSFLNVDWKAIGSMLMEFFRNGNTLSNTVSIATSVVSGFANAIIGIVFAIYILLQKENLGRQFQRLFYAFLPEKQVDRFLMVCGLTSSSFNSFLSGQCLEAFILGMMFFVSMSVFQMPYALVIAVLIGITALIPDFRRVYWLYCRRFSDFDCQPDKGAVVYRSVFGAAADRGERNLSPCGGQLGGPSLHLGAGGGNAGRESGRCAGHFVCHSGILRHIYSAADGCPRPYQGTRDCGG